MRIATADLRATPGRGRAGDPRRLAVLVFLGLLAAAAGLGCSPGITVNNNAGVEVKVAVFPPGGGKSIKTMRAGQSSLVDVWLPGRFSATVVVSKDWIDFAKTKRDLLAAIVDAPGQTSAQVAQVKQQLGEITAKINAFQEPGASAASCAATLKQAVSGGGSDDFGGVIFPIPLIGAGSVDVTTDSANKLKVTCTAQDISQ